MVLAAKVDQAHQPGIDVADQKQAQQAIDADSSLKDGQKASQKQATDNQVDQDAANVKATIDNATNPSDIDKKKAS